jgi:mannan endo-1,4-beta-mannosidase
MAWELANEPRPMRPAAVEGYKDWIKGSAEFIKGLDNNHLVTTGSEGVIGSEHINIFKGVHSDKNIDYLTIHIWPKNWSWFKDTAIAASMDPVKINTANYIQLHDSLALEMKKPLVIEEFGMPRDKHSFSLNSATRLRDDYYEFILRQLVKSIVSKSAICGANFWAFSGAGRPAKNGLFWKPGADRLGDPPQEEQGLNSVFDSDKSTWKVIEPIAKAIRLQMR